VSIADRREQRIKELVDYWFETDDQLDAVYQFEIPDSDDAHATVLLLQVTEATPTSPGEVVAYGFAPSKDFEFPLALAQVTPDEWKAIQHGELPLPHGWSQNKVRKIRPAA